MSARVPSLAEIAGRQVNEANRTKQQRNVYSCNVCGLFADILFIMKKQFNCCDKEKTKNKKQ